MKVITKLRNNCLVKKTPQSSGPFFWSWSNNSTNIERGVGLCEAYDSLSFHFQRRVFAKTTLVAILVRFKWELFFFVQPNFLSLYFSQPLFFLVKDQFPKLYKKSFVFSGIYQYYTKEWEDRMVIMQI